MNFRMLYHTTVLRTRAPILARSFMHLLLDLVRVRTRSALTARSQKMKAFVTSMSPLHSRLRISSCRRMKLLLQWNFLLIKNLAVVGSHQQVRTELHPHLHRRLRVVIYH